MSPSILLARVDRSGSESPQVLAPDVGWWWDGPASGAAVGPGSDLGQFQRLNRRNRLILPEGVAGVVEDRDSRGVRAVGYGDLLFRLRPTGGDAPAPPAAGRSAGADLPPGAFAVAAPTEGIFYRRLAPEAPPFVEIGTRLQTGQVVGLVEVMKTFNQIVYGGPGLPDEAEVVEIRREDGAEVVAGEPLLIVR